MKQLGVLGGTFDPIHYGHLVAADAAAEALNLDRVLFVPCGQPPHRPAGESTPAEHRYLMTVLATAGHPRFRVSRMELDRAGPSYTVDTLAALRRQLGPGIDLTFIVGADAFLLMDQWKDPERIMELAMITVVSRPGYNDGAVEARLRALPESLRVRVRHLEIDPLNISARELRRRLREGRSVRYLIPPQVLAYIEQHGLYRGENVQLLEQKPPC
ncbi:MAG TPA: nicotinate-nucleotide adenylyltransferase [Bacillota bacterium]